MQFHARIVMWAKQTLVQPKINHKYVFFTDQHHRYINPCTVSNMEHQLPARFQWEDHLQSCPVSSTPNISNDWLQLLYPFYVITLYINRNVFTYDIGQLRGDCPQFQQPKAFHIASVLQASPNYVDYAQCLDLEYRAKSEHWVYVQTFKKYILYIHT